MNCTKCDLTPWAGRTPVDQVPAGHVRMSGRGLCASDYASAHRRRGEHLDYPRATLSREDLLDSYAVYRARHHNLRPMARIRTIAPQMGMSPASLQRALERARAAGDARAVA